MKKIIEKKIAKMILRALNVKETDDSIEKYTIEIKPYKVRSTGYKSQNHHYFGHIRLIAQETGESIQSVHNYVKMRAVGMGYPYHITQWGEITGKSESEATTQEASILIEAAHIVASELNIRLIESENEDDVF